MNANANENVCCNTLMKAVDILFSFRFVYLSQQWTQERTIKNISSHSTQNKAHISVSGKVLFFIEKKRQISTMGKYLFAHIFLSRHTSNFMNDMFLQSPPTGIRTTQRYNNNKQMWCPLATFYISLFLMENVQKRDVHAKYTLSVHSGTLYHHLNNYDYALM